MRKKYHLFILLAFGLLLSCENKEGTSQQPQYTDTKSYIDFKCTMCHFSDRIFQKKRKPEEWLKIVNRMHNRNRQWITVEDKQRILEYLLTERSVSDEQEETKTPEIDSEVDIGLE